MEELITTLDHLEHLIRDRRKEFLEIPGVDEEIVNAIRISIPIKRNAKLKESYLL